MPSYANAKGLFKGGLMLLVLASFFLPWDSISFAPQVGSAVSKTFEGRCELTLDSLTMTMDGKEGNMGRDGVRQGCTGTYSVLVNDQYEAVKDGRPVDMVRTYGPIVGTFESSEGGSHEGTLDTLEGKAVRFTWGATESAYEVSYEGGEGDGEALRVMTPDMDYRSLLPPGAVSKDDAWTLGGDDLLEALIPGMDIRTAAATGMQVNGKAIPPAAIDLLDKYLKTAEVSCKYAGVSEVDGVEVAQVDVKGKLAGTTGFDPSDFIDSVEGTKLEPGSWVTLVLDLELDGTLLWGVGTGHFTSFEIEGVGTIDMSMAVSMGDFDTEFALTASLDLKQEARATDAK